MKIDYSQYSNVHSQLMAHFDAPLPYNVKDYYGVSMYKAKRNNKYCFQLIYDYNKHSVNSKNKYEVETLDEALMIYGILDWFANDKSDRKAPKIEIKVDNNE